MKHSITLFAFIFISTIAFSQERNTLKGPEYKNYKPWQHKAKPVAIFINTAKEGLKGPAYKNRKIWDTEKKDLELLTITTSKRSKLKGPAYKNYKPWKKNN